MGRSSADNSNCILTEKMAAEPRSKCIQMQCMHMPPRAERDCAGPVCGIDQSNDMWIGCGPRVCGALCIRIFVCVAHCVYRCGSQEG
jgi:hypothetical protein